MEVSAPALLRYTSCTRERAQAVGNRAESKGQNSRNFQLREGINKHPGAHLQPPGLLPLQRLGVPIMSEHSRVP